MALQQTFVMIKPDAVARGLVGEIVARFERKGMKVKAMRLEMPDPKVIERHYEVHKARPFYAGLVKFMTEGPVVVQVLEGDNAIAKNRELMGATDPKKADKGTIRADFAQSIDANAVHGSDSIDNARTEVAYFFPACEVYSR